MVLKPGTVAQMGTAFDAAMRAHHSGAGNVHIGPDQALFAHAGAHIQFAGRIAARRGMDDRRRRGVAGKTHGASLLQSRRRDRSNIGRLAPLLDPSGVLQGFGGWLGLRSAGGCAAVLLPAHAADGLPDGRPPATCWSAAAPAAAACASPCEPGRCTVGGAVSTSLPVTPARWWWWPLALASAAAASPPALVLVSKDVCHVMRAAIRGLVRRGQANQVAVVHRLRGLGRQIQLHDAQ